MVCNVSQRISARAIKCSKQILSLVTSVYRKPTNNGLFLHFQSHVDKTRVKQKSKTVIKKRFSMLISGTPSFFSQSSDILLSLSELHYLQHKYTNSSTYRVYNNNKIYNYKSITLPTKIYNNSITYTLLTIQCDYRCYLQ